jgi:hypothetical protein
MEPLTITLPPGLRGFVEDQASAGGVSVDEFIASLVVCAQLKQHQAEIDELLKEALASESALLDDAEWASIRQEVRERLQAKQSP